MGETVYDPMSYVWRVLLVLGLAFAAALWVRTRWRGAGRGTQLRRRLHVVDSLGLGPQRHVHVIEVDGRKHLIGVTPQHITYLTALDEGRGAPSGPADDGGGTEPLDFQALLQGAEGTDPGEGSAT